MRNKILKKVLSHLHNDIKDENEAAREDKELASEIRRKQDRAAIKSTLVRKGMIPKKGIRSSYKKKK